MSTQAVLSEYDEFDARSYVEYYFKSFTKEDSALLDALDNAFQLLPSGQHMLEFGGGPTVYQLISASLKNHKIVFAEYLPQNRQEIIYFLAKDPRAFDWTHYFNYIAEKHGRRGPELMEKLRQQIYKVLPCDIWAQKPISGLTVKKFDVVSTHFCVECLSPDYSVFERALRRVTDYVRQDGNLVISFLRNAEWYSFGGRERFPSTKLNENDIERALAKCGFKIRNLSTLHSECEDGYDANICVVAKRIRPSLSQ